MEEKKTLEVQTRSDSTGIKVHDSVKDAFKFTEQDWTVWKISWTDPVTGERIRFVRLGTSTWQYSPMDIEITEMTHISRKYNPVNG